MQPVRPVRWADALRPLFPLVLLFFTFAAGMASAATTVVTDVDKGSSVHIKAGDLLEVRLPANPSTGYMWYVLPKSTALLRLTGQKQTESAEPGAGRPVVQVFTFQPKRVGDGILLLHYVRSWEKPTLGDEQFMLNVVVE